MTKQNALSVLSVLSAHPAEPYIANTHKNENSISVPRTYTKCRKYMGYVPWPTPCDVAEEIKRMAKCEHLAAESRGEATFDWAERSLKQKRNILDHEQLVNWVWRQWNLKIS